MRTRGRKTILAIVMSMMMAMTMMPGMAFADETISFVITGAENSGKTIDIGETEHFGVSITKPENYGDDYHIHCDVTSGKQFIDVAVSGDLKSFDVKGVKETAKASGIQVSLREGSSCGGDTCSSATVGTQSLNVEVANPDIPENPFQGDSQQLKLCSHHMKVIDDTADPIQNRIVKSAKDSSTIELDGKQDISFRFMISNQGNHLGTYDFINHIHILKDGSDEDCGMISWNTVPETSDNDFDVTVAANTLEPGSYKLRFDKDFHIRANGREISRTIEYKFDVAPVKVTSITFDRESAVVKAGESITLNAEVGPEDATDKTLVWTSSNKKVAKVENGVVTAVAAGTAEIKASSADGSVSAVCKVTVPAVKVTGVKVSPSKVTITAGKSKTLKASVYPANATSRAVTWKTSSSRIAKVSSAGKVTAVRPGKATVTVTTKDGSFKAKTIVNVVPKGTTLNLYGKKRAVTVKYKKIKGISGYQIYRAASKNGKYSKVVSRAQKYKGTYTNTGLKSGKTYYYKIRTYKTVSGKKIYSGFSPVKKIKTK